MAILFTKILNQPHGWTDPHPPRAVRASVGQSVGARNELTAARGIPSSLAVMTHPSNLLILVAVFAFPACVTTPPPPPTPEQSFKLADTNGDGKVSRAEYDAHQIGQMFARFDTNKDDVITEAEFLANGGTVEGFRRVNTSGTGKATLAEAKASPGVRKTLDAPFIEADANRDGSVSLSEFLTYRTNLLSYVQ